MKEFFQTTNISQQQAKEAEDKAKGQTEAVRELFSESILPLTASEAWKILIKRNVLHPATPLTSVRRSISVMKKNGELQRTKDMKIGIYSASEHYYTASFITNKMAG